MAGRPEIVGVWVLVMSLVCAGSDSFIIGEMIAAVVSKLVVAVSTLALLAVMGAVSVVLVSLTKGDGDEILAELERAG